VGDEQADEGEEAGQRDRDPHEERAGEEDAVSQSQNVHAQGGCALVPEREEVERMPLAREEDRGDEGADEGEEEGAGALVADRSREPEEELLRGLRGDHRLEHRHQRGREAVEDHARQERAHRIQAAVLLSRREGEEGGERRPDGGGEGDHPAARPEREQGGAEGERERPAEGRAPGDAQDEGIRQRVAEQALIGGPRGGEADSRDGGEREAGQPEAEEDPSVQGLRFAQGAAEIDGLGSGQAAEDEEDGEEEAEPEEDRRRPPRGEAAAIEGKGRDGDPAHGPSPWRIWKSSSRLSITRGPGRTRARERAGTTFPSQPGSATCAPSSMVVSITRSAGSRSARSAGIVGKAPRNPEATFSPPAIRRSSSA